MQPRRVRNAQDGCFFDARFRSTAERFNNEARGRAAHPGSEMRDSSAPRRWCHNPHLSPTQIAHQDPSRKVGTTCSTMCNPFRVSFLKSNEFLGCAARPQALMLNASGVGKFQRSLAAHSSFLNCAWLDKLPRRTGFANCGRWESPTRFSEARNPLWGPMPRRIGIMSECRVRHIDASKRIADFGLRCFRKPSQRLRS